MPWTLYRYLLTDLVRVVGLTAAVLVTVIAFGATIKPLASQMLLDAGQTAKYLGLAIVPMLQFALPFAAGFGATITLHRMTADNEIQAMSASGISYRRILALLLALGLALSGCMVVLTQSIIPRFWVMIEQTLAVDITRLFQAAVEKGEPFQIQSLQIFADKIMVEDNPPDTQADTRLRLWHVAAVELDDDGKIATDVTANQAVVDVYRREGRTYLKLVMTETAVHRAREGQLLRAPEIGRDRALLVPSSIDDNPKAMSRGQLLHLRKKPDDFGQVRQARGRLIEAMRAVAVHRSLDQRFRADGAADMHDAGEATRVYEIHADHLDDKGRIIARGSNGIKVHQIENGEIERTFVARAGALTTSVGTALGDLVFDLELIDCTVREGPAGGPVTNQRPVLKIPGLTAVVGPEMIVDDDIPSEALLERVEPLAKDSLQLRNRIVALRREMTALDREITARLWNRYALSTTATLLLLLGSVLAMWLRDSLPLTIYLWAFVPSIIDLITISAGEQMMRDARWFAPMIMWSGNAFMLMFVMYAYRKLSRH